MIEGTYRPLYLEAMIGVWKQQIFKSISAIEKNSYLSYET